MINSSLSDFMPQSNQEYPAWGFQSSPYNAGYDCELPPSIRSEGPHRGTQ
jgi:hypothetical protein